MFLIHFEYEEWVQGYEWTSTYLLVEADSFKEACNIVLGLEKYYNVKNFVNLTILKP